MKIVRIIAAILALAGLAILAFAVQGYRSQARFLEDASAATGEVTEVTRRRSSSSVGMKPRSSTYYTFRVKFQTPRGETIEGEAMQSSSSPRFADGEKVPVLFSRTRPSDFNIDDFAMLWADVVVFFVFAGTFIGAGASAFWIAGGKSRRGVRTEAKLAEVARAWREGRLTRDSEYQGLLVAFAFAGFPLLGGAIVFLLFAPGVVQVIVGAVLVFIAIQAIRARRAATGASKPSRKGY